MDINKIMDLLGLGDGKTEELEEAMQKQLIADFGKTKTTPGPIPAVPASSAPATDAGTEIPLPEHTQLMSAGRCPSCGDRILARAEQPCAWCGAPCNATKDGFHLVHVALGAFQERHAFCSDDCFEAFRRMYPARVHRDCYERLCRDCHFCIKRFTDESDGFSEQEAVSRSLESGTTQKA